MSQTLEMQSAAVTVAGQDLLAPMNLSLTGQGISAVMGPNGAGKSLFLRLIHGLIRPSAGKVLWDGLDAVATVRNRGFVFQDNPVMRRSVVQNIAFPLKAIGAQDVAARVQRALENARLADKAHLPAAQLSGGQRQRMALARALVVDPKTLLLDEPSASLDPVSTKALEEMVQQAVSKGVKVIIATHDLGQARRLADEVLFFDHGVVSEHSDAAGFFNAPKSDAARAYFEGRL